MPLFEIVLTASKVFYIEGRTRDDVLDSGALEEEQGIGGRTGNYEHNETDVRQINQAEAERIRKATPELILEA